MSNDQFTTSSVNESLVINTTNNKTTHNNNGNKKPYKLNPSRSFKPNRSHKTLASPTTPHVYHHQYYPIPYYEKQINIESDQDKQLITPPSSPEAVPHSANNYKMKTSSTFEYNNRILSAKRNGNIRVVMSEFVSMKKNNIQMTQHTYNLVLEAHAILRKEGTPLTAMLKSNNLPLFLYYLTNPFILVYNEMLQMKIQPNTYTYILMIRTLCKRDVEVQKTVAMLKRQSARIGHENEDVGLLEAEHNLEKALSIFHCAVSDGVSINTFEVEIFNQLLRVLSHYGDTTDANFVYNQLEQPHVLAKPNSATYAALINLFGRAGYINTALYYYDVYRQVKESLGPHDTSYIFNALVDCHLKCNLLEGALHVVEHEMVENGIKLTCIPYNSIIRHYCAHGQMKEAEALIQRLIDGHSKDSTKYPYPDASSYGPILSAYCQADNWPSASSIYQQLRKTDISKAYGNLANYALLCLSHHDRHTALTVIDDMTRAHLEPDPNLAERIIQCFAETSSNIHEAIDALHKVQAAMSPRSLTKGGQHILDGALEVVLRCTSITQVLCTMHSITNLIKNNPSLATQPSGPEHVQEEKSTPSSYMIMCKTLIDSYLDPSQNADLTAEDFVLLFEACLMVECASLGDVLVQILHDMRHRNVTVTEGLYHRILTQLKDDPESETQWKMAFGDSTVAHAMDSSLSSANSCATMDDEDIIIEIAEQDVPSYTTSKSELASHAILKAIINGNNREAIRLFEDKIICKGLIPTPEVMRDAIIIAGKQNDLNAALTLYNNSIYAFKDIQDAETKDEAIYMATNSLLMGYAQKGDMDKAKLYHDRIRAMGRCPDSNGYASMLLGSAKCATDEATDALAIYDEAKRHNVKPTTFFYNVVISKLAKARKLDAALVLFEEMKQFKIPANSITYGAIISASVRSGSEIQSQRLFNEMLSSPSYQPRVGPFNNMMQFYVRQHPDRERVIEYFSELRRRRIKPSPHSYKLLMESYTHIAPYDMPMAHKLLGDMTRCDGLRPQATHYATLIYSYGILQRDVQSAERVFIEMKKSNIEPDEAVYQAMIDTLISNDALETAETYYDAMTVHCGSPYIENLFIRGYGEKGMLDKAEAVFEAMSDDKSLQASVIIREPSTYEAMIRAYLENDQIEKAKKTLDKMVKRDFPPKVLNVVADLVLE